MTSETRRGMKSLGRPRLASVATVVAVAIGLAGVFPGGADRGSTASNYRLVVPGLAGGVSEPGPAPTGEAVVTRNVSAALRGGLVISGDVYNGLDTAIINVKVRGTATAPGGNLLGSRETPILLDEVPPHQLRPFQVSITGVTDIGAAVSAVVSSFDVVTIRAAADDLVVTASSPRAIETVEYDPETGATYTTTSATTSQVTGTVTNTGGRPVRSVAVIVAFYDASDHLRLVVRSAPVQAPSGPAGVLNPGETAAYSAQLLTQEYLAIGAPVRVVAFVNAISLD